MKSCLSCMFIITLIAVFSCVGFGIYYFKGCSYSIDTIVKVENLDYATGTKWVVRANNTDYVIASDQLFSIMKPELLADKLQIGHTYKFRTCGFDIPIIKYNKIIVNVEEIK